MVNVEPTKSRATFNAPESNTNIAVGDYVYLIEHGDGLRIISSDQEVEEFEVGATLSVRHARADFVIGGVEILAQKILGEENSEEIDSRLGQDELDRRLAHWAIR